MVDPNWDPEANSGSTWTGLKSPDASAYKSIMDCVTVFRTAGSEAPSVSSAFMWLSREDQGTLAAHDGPATSSVTLNETDTNLAPPRTEF